MLAQWVAGGGHRRPSVTRFPPAVIFSHFLLAAAGLVLWIIYLVNDQDALGWVALIVLAVVAALGLTMLVRWIPRYRSSQVAAGAQAQQPTTKAAASESAPERKFPVAIVAGHGVLAIATVVLVLLVTLGLGG